MPQKSILVIYNSPEEVPLIKRALSQIILEHTVVFIETGSEALTYLEHVHPRPDFIILDANLPGFGGFEVLGAIRKNEHLQNIRVAMLSSTKMPDQRTIRYSWSNKFIVKPFPHKEYIKMIQDLYKGWMK